MTVSNLTPAEHIEKVLREHEREWGDGLETLYCGEGCDWSADGYMEATPDMVLRTNGQDTEVPAIAAHRAHVAAVLASLLAEHWATRIESMIPAGAPMSDYMHGMKDAAYLVRGLGGDT